MRWSLPLSAARCWSTSTCSGCGPRRQAVACRSRSGTRSRSPGRRRDPQRARPRRRAPATSAELRRPRCRLADRRPSGPPPAAAHPPVPPQRPAAALRGDRRPALPHARLSASCRPVRHRPRRRLRLRWADGVLEPLLPVPPTPPDQDLCAWVELRDPRRPAADRPHSERRLEDERAPGMVLRRRAGSAVARRGSPAGSAPVLTPRTEILTRRHEPRSLRPRTRCLHGAGRGRWAARRCRRGVARLRRGR